MTVAGMFAERTVLVTGGSRGLGAATARAFAAEGADVAISYVASGDKADDVVAELRAAGVRAAAFRADQGDRAAVTRLVDSVVAEFGGIDILVTNASFDETGRIDDPGRDEPAFDRFWAVTHAGFMATVRAVSRVIRPDGRIVMVSSNLGTRPGMPGIADLAALRGAIDGFSRGAARDLATRGVTVNVVHSGLMDTARNQASLEMLGPLLSGLCFPRLGRVEEIVAPIMFLASPGASYITGSGIDADGGYTS